MLVDAMNLPCKSNDSSKNDGDEGALANMPARMVEEEEVDNLDALIAGALNRLSINERENVYHEMHGVDDAVEETPEMLQRSIIALHTELENQKGTHRAGLAYNMAEAMSRNYVLDLGLRIKFLRSEKFDVKKSAERIIKFFDVKLSLFGQEKLCKDITLQDLDSDDMVFIKSGYIQLLPTRDRSGRVAMFLLFSSESKHKIPDNVARVMFYILMTAIEDEETQKRGATAVAFSQENIDVKSFDYRTLGIGTRMTKSLPIRTCSHHVCFHRHAFRTLVNAAVNLLPEDGRARIKLHSGTQTEILYELMTFGIHTDSMPLSTEGELKRKNHLEFIKMRQRQESMVGATRIVIPTHKDVLFGRGKPFREHRGNLNLFEMIDNKLEYYESVPTKQKTEAIMEMVDAVKESGGRFLKQDDGCWMTVDEKMAKEKVSHAFRTRLRIALSEKGESRKNSDTEVVSEGKKRLKTAPSDQDL